MENRGRLPIFLGKTGDVYLFFWGKTGGENRGRLPIFLGKTGGKKPGNNQGRLPIFLDIAQKKLYVISMPRAARIVISDAPHHITQRGNNQQDVFFVDDDREKFLYLLGEQSKRFGMIIDGFCLMTNHIHLIATPTREDSLAKTMGRVNLLYSQYLNYMHGRTGHLWQNRFFSCPLDTNHYFTALSYIEQNPVRAKMVLYPWTYRWSSAGFHSGGEDEFGLMNRKRWQRQSSGIDWKNILRK